MLHFGEEMLVSLSRFLRNRGRRIGVASRLLFAVEYHAIARSSSSCSAVCCF